MSALSHRHSGPFPHRHRGTRGQAQVEFALVIIFLMILILSMLELLTLMHTYNVLADAAKEGVRYAVVHGANNPQGITCTATSCSTPDLTNPPAPPGSFPGFCSAGVTCYGVVTTFAQYSLHDMTGLTVNVTYPDTGNLPLNKAPNRVKVVVTYPYRPWFNLGWLAVTVNAAAEGRIMN